MSKIIGLVIVQVEFAAKRLRRLSAAISKNWMVSFEADNGKVITILACTDNEAGGTVIPESLVKKLVNPGMELHVTSILSGRRVQST